METGTAELLQVSDVHKWFGDLHVLKGVSFSVKPGECVAIIGPSGSGKSTCLRTINYLEPPGQGEIRLQGELIGQRATSGTAPRLMSDTELSPQRARIGMVFQLFHLWPHLTALQNVALQPRKVGGMSQAEASALALEMLIKVHLKEKADQYPDRLSGGQQQRVAIARVLAQSPELILFDEPTSALDPELVGEVLLVIQELAKERRAMVLVTHEIAFARRVADRIIFMDGGLIVEEGPPGELLDAPKSPRLQKFLQQMKQ